MNHYCRASAASMAALLLVTALGCDRTTKTPTTPPVDDDSTAAEIDVKLVREQPQANASPSLLLTTMERELERGMTELRGVGDPPPYFMAYEVVETHSAYVAGSHGALQGSDESTGRSLDVDVRVGSHEFDNNRLFRLGWGYATQTPPAAGGRGQAFSPFGGVFGSMALSDDPDAIAGDLWSATIGEYRGAVQSLAAAKARVEVQVEQEDDSDDFSRETAVTHLEAPQTLSFDRDAWEGVVRRVSGEFKKHRRVLTSAVEVNAQVENRYFASSEGARIQSTRPHVRIMMVGTTKAEDGMDLQLVDIIDTTSIEELPGEAELVARVDALAEQLGALAKAPVAEPFSGPAILEGRAAAVYFHEVFGHRVEGHRQKNENEGQTFAEKVGTQVMPEFMNVFDDPSIRSLDGTDLNGHYFYDNEGIRGSKASLVEDGTFVGFLMSRSPTRGFDHSNGHGRRQPGLRVAARQGNLIVAPQRGVGPDALKAKLLERIKEQGKPYGLRFVDISGGVTLTSRFMPQVFQVQPVIVYRVYPDGREELVRGVTLEGTPLVSLSKIVAARDHFEVFNGFCGAESGFVPVSAASPDLLLDQIEVARAPKSQAKPPLLEPPPLSARGTTGGVR